MTVRDVDCNCEDLNNDGDLRDECLADWKKSAENNKSEVEWKDFKKTLSGIVCKLFKERSYDGYEFMRVVIESNSYGCEVDGPLKAGFGFIKGSWYLAGFGSYEVE